MTLSKKWQLTLERQTKNKLNPEITNRKLQKIAESIQLGFKTKPGRLKEPITKFDQESQNEVHCYTVTMEVSRDNVENPDKLEAEWQYARGTLVKAAAGDGWTVTGPTSSADEQGISLASNGTPQPASTRPRFILPPFTDDVRSTYFGDVYERQDQLHELYGAIRTHVETAGEVANHAILYGQPGACKTVLCERLRDWFNADGSRPTNEWVRFVDGTTTSKAGAEQYFRNLVEGDDVPAVLVLDEIEKNEKTWLLCLLSIMGSGIVTKLKYGSGNYRGRFSPYIIGICNDEQSLRDFKNESLWSRFTHEIYCPRPTKELCYLILSDIVSQMGGKQEWVEPALDFGWEKLGQRDVRKIKGHLDGRDDLMTGEYQLAKRRMLEIERKEKELISREQSKNVLSMAI